VGLGRLVSLALALALAGTPAVAAGIAYTYDALGRLKTATYPDGKIVSYIYDASGNRTQKYVGQANNPPIANTDYADATGPDAQSSAFISIYPLTNDSDPDQHTLTITSITNLTLGSATIVGTRIDVSGIPIGGTSFDYTISDGNGGSDTAGVYISRDYPPCGQNCN
jgi:YD repeat-containing protein